MRIRQNPRIRLTVLSFLILSIIIAGGSMAARRRAKSEDPASLKRKLSTIRHQRQDALQHLRVVQRRLPMVKRDLQEANRALSETKARYSAVTSNVQDAREHLSQAISEYRASEVRLEGHKEDVSDRLVAIYKLGEVRPVEVLLQSTSYSDFANRLYLLNQVVERDAELIDRYQEAQTSAEQHRDNVRAEERKLTEVQSEVAERKRRVAEWRDKREEDRARLIADRAAYERALTELEVNSRQVTTMLERLERRRTGRPSVKPWRGGLSFPVSGRITSRFGYRTHPIFHVRKMHTGIDIGAGYGSAIHAAAGGTVVFAGRWGGYGNCVIIDHGGGLATLYGHCSSIAVGEGQSVKQGQTIAAVGSTGLSTGPHLHFETRRNGRPVDPSGF